MTRRQIREEIFKAVFQAEFHNEDVEEQAAFTMDLAKASGKEKQAMNDKCTAILESIDDLDAVINQASDNWKTGRMAKVDLTLLRIATYEIKIEKLEPAIAINEAVEMAKLYGSDKSYAFVNGVLGKVANE